MRRSRRFAAAAIATIVVTWAFAGSRPSDAKERSAPLPRPALVELGHRLFFDPAVSRTGRVACASCHDPDHGFTDRAHPSIDESGPMRRRAMPVTDLPKAPMHSDGEFADVRALIDARLRPFDDFERNALEPVLNNLGVEVTVYGFPVGGKVAFTGVADRLASDGYYASEFTAVFGEVAPTTDRVIDAVEAYVYSVRTGENALDRFLAGDDAALAAPAQRGLALFTGRAGCVQCHVVTPASGRAPLRDGKFHDTGIAWRTALATRAESPMRDADQGQGAHQDRAAERERDRMRFKTPSLRDVARRGPFMHDGSLRTLADVIDYYDRGGARHPGLDPKLRRLDLTEDERTDLLAFLLSLSAPERAAVRDVPQGDRTRTFRVVEPDGRPIVGAAVGIEPEGDRLRSDAPPAAIVARTDASGRVTFRFPPTTHVRVRVAGHGEAGGGLVPDCAADVELVAVPDDVVALRVLAPEGGLPQTVRASPSETFGVLGRPGLPRQGDPVLFSLVRALSPSDGIYLARPMHGAPGSARRLFHCRGGKGPGVVQADLDLDGGAVTSIDVRPSKGSVPETQSESARR